MLWSSWSRAADYVVHVSLIDGRAVTQASVKRLEKFLRKANPDLELKSIKYELDNLGVDKIVLDKVRTRLGEISTEQGQRIRLLVLNTPDELDLIEPLQGKLASYARVVVLGHKSARSARDRLTELGLPNGSVFELTSEPYRRVTFGLGAKRFKVLGLGALGLGITSGILAAMGNEYDAIIPAFTSTSLVSLAVSATAVVLWDRLVPWIGILSGRLDFGRVTQLWGGDVKTETRLRASRRRLVFACEDQLMR